MVIQVHQQLLGNGKPTKVQFCKFHSLGKEYQPHRGQRFSDHDLLAVKAQQQAFITGALYKPKSDNVGVYINRSPYSPTGTGLIIGNDLQPRLIDSTDKIAIAGINEALKIFKITKQMGQEPFLGMNVDPFFKLLGKGINCQSLLPWHIHVGMKPVGEQEEITPNSDRLKSLLGSDYSGPENTDTMYFGSQTEQLLLNEILKSLKINRGLTTELHNTGLDIVFPPNLYGLNPSQVYKQVIRPIQQAHEEVTQAYALGLTGVNILKPYYSLLNNKHKVTQEKLQQAQQTVAGLQAKGFNNLEKALSCVSQPHQEFIRDIYQVWQGDTNTMAQTLVPVPAMTMCLTEQDNNIILRLRALPHYAAGGLLQGQFKVLYKYAKQAPPEQIEAYTQTLEAFWNARKRLSDTVVPVNTQQFANFGVQI